TTDVLDNFNRADGSFLANGTWTCPARPGASALEIGNNAVIGTSASQGLSNDCYWSSASFGPDTEAYATIPSLSSSFYCQAVFARASNLNSSSLQAYWAE